MKFKVLKKAKACECLFYAICEDFKGKTTVDLVTLQSFKAKPKWFLPTSDNTNLF